MSAAPVRVGPDMFALNDARRLVDVDVPLLTAVLMLREMEEAGIVLCELMTNAVRHARNSAGDAIKVRCEPWAGGSAAWMRAVPSKHHPAARLLPRRRLTSPSPPH